VRFRRIELDPVARRLHRVANVEDLRRIARRRLPRGVFDYVDGGAEDEVTLADNTAAFGRYQLRPRVLVDVADVDTTTTVLGRPVALPLVLSPTGFTRMVDPQGELSVARAAARAGVPYSLSTLATRSIEEVGACSPGAKWFQVYVWRDRALVKDMLQRAQDSGYEAILITVDTAVPGRRERDVRRGFTLPPKIGMRTILDGALHPGWTWAFLRSEPITFANLVGTGRAYGSEPVSLSEYINTQFDPSLSWRDLDWIRSSWNGPVVIKGIQTVADAVIAADAGVEAIALSNHGGRQLDGAPAPVDLVAPVRDAVGDRIEILCDGGVRRGGDIIKALALGANACMTGRPYLYALGAGGERGVELVLQMFAEGVRRTMALCGCRRIGEIGPELVRDVRAGRAG